MWSFPQLLHCSDIRLVERFSFRVFFLGGGFCIRNQLYCVQNGTELNKSVGREFMYKHRLVQVAFIHAGSFIYLLEVNLTE